MTNADIQALLDRAVAEIEQTTITYQDWKQRVVSGFYAGKHIDPTSGTAWGRGIGYLERARAALDPTPAPTPTPTPPPSPTPVPSRGAVLPVGPFTESKTAKWYRTTAGGTVSKQRVSGAPDYGVALMGTFSPAAPPPSTGVWTVEDCVGEKIGKEPPAMNGTGEAGIWLGQRVKANRLRGHGTWMGAWTGAQCCDSTIDNLTCAILNADGTLGRLPRIGLYIEHATRRVVIDGLTIRAQANGVNSEWWYSDGTYAAYVAKELSGAPAGKAGSWSVEIRNFDIDSGAWGIFLDAGTCGFHIHDGVLRGVDGISHPANLAVPSMPNVIDWDTIDFAGSGTKDHVHANQIG